MKTIIAKLIGLYFNVLAWVAPRKAAQQGFLFFCTPQKSTVKDHQQRFLDTADKMRFLFDGYRIQSYRWGHGPKKVLFLHGWGSHSYRWKNYIEALDPSRFTVYAFDAPAHGNSGGKHLNLQIYSLALETFLNLVGPMNAVVGHSLGSFAALYTLHRLGDRHAVDELVVTAPPGEATEFVLFYQSALGLSERSVRLINEAFLHNVQNLPGYFSAKKFALNLPVAGLIVADDGDVETPWHHAESIHRVWPGSRLITTRGLGHNLRSREVVAHVVDFISHDASRELWNSLQVKEVQAN